MRFRLNEYETIEVSQPVCVADLLNVPHKYIASLTAEAKIRLMRRAYASIALNHPLIIE